MGTKITDPCWHRHLQGERFCRVEGRLWSCASPAWGSSCWASTRPFFSHGACADVSVLWMSVALGMGRGQSLAPGLSIVVESRLKQKMQTWPYSLGRNPRVYPEQAPSRTPLACSAEPIGSRRKRFCCVPPKVGQSPEEEQER
jgi:hypothetical protein